MSISITNNNKQIFSLLPDSIVDLYEIDFSNLQYNFEQLNDLYGLNIGAECIYRFCPAINGSNPIIWQSKSYQPLPIEMEGFNHNSDGSLPRPKIRIGNPEGIFSKIFYSNEDFINSKVTRKRTFVRFLDAENFNRGINPFGEPDPGSHYEDDVFYVNRKVSEDKQFIEIELVSVLELEEAFVPARIMMSDYCNWTYRCSIGCGYKGLPIETATKQDLTKNFGYLEGGGSVNSELYEDSSEVPEWNKESAYNLGDVVKITPLSVKNDYQKTESLFVCCQSHLVAKKHHPMIDRKYWMRDECDKTLSACKKRFSDETLKNFNKKDKTHEGLRFGGFPGISKYDIQ
jgi:lambda family phage minor tail protein L